MHDGRGSPSHELAGLDFTHPDYVGGEHGNRDDCATPDSSIGDPDAEVDTVTGE